MFNRFSTTQWVGLAIAAADMGVGVYQATHIRKPLSNKVFVPLILGSVLYIGYGLGKGRPVQISVVDKRPFGS